MSLTAGIDAAGHTPLGFGSLRMGRVTFPCWASGKEPNRHIYQAGWTGHRASVQVQTQRQVLAPRLPLAGHPKDIAYAELPRWTEPLFFAPNKWLPQSSANPTTQGPRYSGLLSLDTSCPALRGARAMLP